MIYDDIILYLYKEGGNATYTRADLKENEHALNKAVHHKLCKRTTLAWDKDWNIDLSNVYLTKKGVKKAKELEFIDNI